MHIPPATSFCYILVLLPVFFDWLERIYKGTLPFHFSIFTIFFNGLLEDSHFSCRLFNSWQSYVIDNLWVVFFLNEGNQLPMRAIEPTHQSAEKTSIFISLDIIPYSFFASSFLMKKAFSAKNQYSRIWSKAWKRKTHKLITFGFFAVLGKLIKFG